MIAAFLGNLRANEAEKSSIKQAARDKVKRELAILIRKFVTTILPAFLALFSVIALCGVVVVAVLAVIYNSPFSIFSIA